MRGMALAKEYYESYGQKMIEECCGDFAENIAVGLAGEGSQCFGYDDEISWDHDFGPGFCIWLREKDMSEWQGRLAEAYKTLPSEFRGFSTDNIQDKSRLGVMSAEGFFRKYTGLDKPPQNNREWLFLRETDLAVCTNGEVFRDDCGMFSAFRNVLLEFYPSDILRKKIAARAAVMSQAGQYNLLRCLRRKDAVAAQLAAAKFSESTLSMIYLLNRKYMPFYKWAFFGAKKLDRLGESARKLENLQNVFSETCRGDFAAGEKIAFELTEEICTEVAAELKRQGFSSNSSAFLQDHLAEIMSGIDDVQIRSLPPIFDYGF